MTTLRFRLDEGLWLLGLLVLTACSWVHFFATGSPKVDENYPTQAVGALLLCGVLLGWTLMVVGWHGLLRKPVANPRRLAFTGLLVATTMLPLLSNDIFSLITYGQLASHGHDVYTTADGLPDSPFFSWVGLRWSHTVCVYGPTALVAIMPAGVAGHSVWAAMWLLRATWLVPLVFIMEVSFRKMADRPRFHAMLWLNPLWMLEGPGQLHADMLGVLAIVAGILAQMRGRHMRAWVYWALATLGKYSFAVTGLWFWLSGARTGKERLARIPVMAAILAVIAVVFFLPFWKGLPTLMVPVHTLANMNPGGSITEVVGHVVHTLRGGPMPQLNAPLAATMEFDRQTKGHTWAIVSGIMHVVSVGVGLRLLWIIFQKPRDEGRIALATGALLVAAVTLASHRFQAWYLLAALPFFGLSCTPAWRRWWVAMVAVSVVPDFTLLVPKGTVVLPVWPAVTPTAACVVLFLSWFPSRYIWIKGLDAPEAKLELPALSEPAA
jgi:hypothetical protein